MEKFSHGENTPLKNETPKDEEKKISRRRALKKIGTAATAVLMGGAVNACDSIIGGPSDEELKKIDKKKEEERRDAILGEPDIMGEHIKNRYAGYADLDSFLKDYSEVRDNPKELKEAEHYFEEQQSK